MMPEDLDKSVAMLLIRVLAGILFFAQAYDKIFNIGISKVAETFGIPLGQKTLRLKWAVALSSYIELFSGILLLFGLFTTIALYILAADLLLVAVAFSILRPMWDMKYYFPRLTLIAALLLFPSEWDTFSLDCWLRL